MLQLPPGIVDDLEKLAPEEPAYQATWRNTSRTYTKTVGLQSTNQQGFLNNIKPITFQAYGKMSNVLRQHAEELFLEELEELRENKIPKNVPIPGSYLRRQ